MSLTHDDAAPALRRAAALLLHHANRDTQGMDAVLAEATTGIEATAMILAFARIFEWVLPELRTPTGIAMLRELLVTAAVQEGNQS